MHIFFAYIEFGSDASDGFKFIVRVWSGYTSYLQPEPVQTTEIFLDINVKTFWKRVFGKPYILFRLFLFVSNQYLQ